MPSRYSNAALAQMKVVRQLAKSYPAAICWWCGSRPFDERWSADHVYPLMGEASPVVAACLRCNQMRQEEVPTYERVQRLLRAGLVVRSVDGETIRRIGLEECVRRWGRDDCLDLLIAAVPGKARVFRDGRRDRTYSAMLI